MRDVEIDIFELVKQVMHRSSAHIQQGIVADGLTIAPMEARCLRYVVRHPGCIQGDIVAVSGRDKAQIARVIKLLIERGHAVRLADEPGERPHRLAATSEGIWLHEQAERHRAAVAHRMLENLDDAERLELRNLLERVAHRLESA